MRKNYRTQDGCWNCKRISTEGDGVFQQIYSLCHLTNPASKVNEACICDEWEKE